MGPILHTLGIANFIDSMLKYVEQTTKNDVDFRNKFTFSSHTKYIHN